MSLIPIELHQIAHTHKYQPPKSSALFPGEIARNILKMSYFITLQKAMVPGSAPLSGSESKLDGFLAHVLSFHQRYWKSVLWFLRNPTDKTKTTSLVEVIIKHKSVMGNLFIKSLPLYKNSLSEKPTCPLFISIQPL